MPALAPRLLIADDQTDVIEALRLLLKQEGFQIEPVRSPAAALRAAQAREFDLALVDLNYTRDTTSGGEGLDLLSALHSLDSTLPVLVMTAWANIDLAVEAMRRGARDFITKPWDNARLVTTIRTNVDLARSTRACSRLAEENQALRASGRQLPTLIARSVAMRPVLDIIERVGPSDANVLITGENGTGKGLIAQAMHAVSAQSEAALVSVNMGGLAEGLFESELFGHVRGAFTDAKTDRAGRFELADGGTLFLDEIGNIPLAQQAKLLRTLETGEFERVGSSKTQRARVRLISATNAELGAEVAAGRFRQDLLFRLNTIQLHLPPLRDRQEDIEPLASHFLRQHAARYRKEITGFEPAALDCLHTHTWPGNVRELDHAIERATLMCGSRVISVGNLGLKPGTGTRNLDEMSLEEVEAHLIRRTLARHKGNARLAAEDLGLSRSAFYRRLEKYKL